MAEQLSPTVKQALFDWVQAESDGAKEIVVENLAPETKVLVSGILAVLVGGITEKNNIEATVRTYLEGSAAEHSLQIAHDLKQKLSELRSHPRTSNAE
jgi:hypothetical protein